MLNRRHVICPVRIVSLGLILCLFTSYSGTARADFLDALGDGLNEIGNAVGDAVTEGVKGGTAITTGKSKIKAQYRLNGQTLTCFDGIKTAYILPRGATSPGAPGTRVTPYDCNKISNIDDVIVLPPAGGGASAAADTGYSDGLGCTDPSWTKDEIISRRREIMECQSDQITERAYQRDLARRRKASRAPEDGGGGAAGSDPEIENIKQNAQQGFDKIQAQVARDAAAAKAAQRRARAAGGE